MKTPPRGRSPNDENYDLIQAALRKASPKKEKGECADPTYSNENFYSGDGVKQALQYVSDERDDLNRANFASSGKNKQLVSDEVPAGLASSFKKRQNHTRALDQSFERVKVKAFAYKLLD